MNEPDRPMTGDGQTVRAAMNGRDPFPERTWQMGDGGDDQYIFPGEQFGSRTSAGLVGFSFIQLAVRRSARIWGTLAVVGLLAGVGLFVARPPAYQASTSVLLIQPPAAQTGWIADDQAIAQSPAVAKVAVRNLGLHESGASFASAYTVVAQTGRVLAITVKATSQRGALREAKALAIAFLTFRRHMLARQERFITGKLRKQLVAAQEHLVQLNGQITALSSQPRSSDMSAKLHSLRLERTQAASALTALKQTVATDEAETVTGTTAANYGSHTARRGDACPTVCEEAHGAVWRRRLDGRARAWRRNSRDWRLGVQKAPPT